MKKGRNRFHQGEFTPINREKYVGKLPCTYRSSWEITCMRFFDNSKDILKWSSESIKINYMDPFTNRWRTYYPDFIIKYKKNNVEITEIVEVKPLNQTNKDFAKSKKDKEACILNEAKWKYAKQWCSNNNILFRVITEKDIYIK